MLEFLTIGTLVVAIVTLSILNRNKTKEHHIESSEQLFRNKAGPC